MVGGIPTRGSALSKLGIWGGFQVIFGREWVGESDGSAKQFVTTNQAATGAPKLG